MWWEGRHAEPTSVVAVQAAELGVRLQAVRAEKAEAAAAVEELQARHTAAGEAASQAAAAAAQALSQVEAQRAGLEDRVASLSAAEQEHAKYHRELEGAAALLYRRILHIWALSAMLYSRP